MKLKLTWFNVHTVTPQTTMPFAIAGLNKIQLSGCQVLNDKK